MKYPIVWINTQLTLNVNLNYKIQAHNIHNTHTFSSLKHVILVCLWTLSFEY